MRITTEVTEVHINRLHVEFAHDTGGVTLSAFAAKLSPREVDKLIEILSEHRSRSFETVRAKRRRIKAAMEAAERVATEAA